jgi:hypothetical protein
MVSTGGERDLWWSKPPTDGRPPSATRRLGLTDLLDILLLSSVPNSTSHALSLDHLLATNTPRGQIRRESETERAKVPTMPIHRRGRIRGPDGRSRSESPVARGGGGTSVNGGAGGGEESGARVAGLGTDLRRGGGDGVRRSGVGGEEGAASGWRSGAIGTGGRCRARAEHGRNGICFAGADGEGGILSERIIYDDGRLARH